jgi:hypothetical protein
MKNHPGHLIWVCALLLALAGLMLASRPSPPDAAAIEALAECKQTLRAQGFETELSDFDFSTTPEEQARAMVLTNAITFLSPDARTELPPLLQPVGKDSAAVLWKLDSVPLPSFSSLTPEDDSSWDAYRRRVSQHRPQLDATAAAILSGPIKFNLNLRPDGHLSLPHLAVIRNLSCAFAGRCILALHDNDWDDAWTNLMAATHLVTAREPEPEDISHSVRYADTTTAFDTLWQVLQRKGWEEKQLLQVQQDWESVDFFTNLPLLESFKRGSLVDSADRSRGESVQSTGGFRDFAETALHFPSYLVSSLAARRETVEYRRHQGYEDERESLFYYRDREVELRDAISARTWEEMRSLPALTNTAPFQLSHPGPLRAFFSLQERLRRWMQIEMIERAAQAEAQRRLIITALALEQFHTRHGMYPKSLAELSPEFLKGQLVDFMDGQPLRYQLDRDGHFLLYSVGLDGVDNGGLMPRPGTFYSPRFQGPEYPSVNSLEYDLVWPRPAGKVTKAAQKESEAEVRQAQLKAKTWQQRYYLTEIADREMSWFVVN